MAYFIVVGNEKGGTGKSTLAMNICVALSRAGKRVGAIDLDLRQQSLARFCENRIAYKLRERISLPSPRFLPLPAAENAQAAQADSRLSQAIAPHEAMLDYIVIDCPGSHTRLSQLAHSLADTLVTPINDSFIDFDLLAHSDPVTNRLTGPSAYSEMVWNARQTREQAKLKQTDWLVVRNRMGAANMHNTQKLSEVMNDLAKRLNFRHIKGFSERVIYRELFPRGLTVQDLGDVGVTNLNVSNKAAVAEIRGIMDALHLPM
jgi:chromosome partitioning protein